MNGLDHYSPVPDLPPKSGAVPYKTTTLDALTAPEPYKVVEPWELGLPGEKAAPLPGFLAGAAEDQKRAAVRSARPAERKAWHADIDANASLLTRPMHGEYLGEETRQEAGGVVTQMGPYAATGTHYANSAAEYRTDIAGGLSQHGAAVNSADRVAVAGGKGVETPGSRRLYAKDTDERVNFAMDAAGGFYTTDPRAETMRRIDRDANTVERVNHTSLLGGADAAAAGSLKVRDGKVENLDDGSGHYKPAAAQTEQAVSALVGSGAMDEMRSSVTLGGKQAGEEALTLSTLELLSYSEAMAADREAFAATGDAGVLRRQEDAIRAAHATKGAMLGELTSTVTAAPDIEAARAAEAAAADAEKYGLAYALADGSTEAEGGHPGFYSPVRRLE